jgi:hypothetical protein
VSTYVQARKILLHPGQAAGFAIQRDHCSRRRAGETVSLTPTISQLGVFDGSEGPGEGIHVLWSW